MNQAYKHINCGMSNKFRPAGLGRQDLGRSGSGRVFIQTEHAARHVNPELLIPGIAIGF